jgi:hypothetical protein
MIANQLTNIDHQVLDENLAFTFLKKLPPFSHTLVVTLNTCIDMELLCGQLM